jgi:hypothetical protein
MLRKNAYISLGLDDGHISLWKTTLATKLKNTKFLCNGFNLLFLKSVKKGFNWDISN